MLTVLKSVDQAFLKSAVSGAQFGKLFFENASDSEIIDYLRSVA
jgi:hypothetical protein